MTTLLTFAGPPGKLSASPFCAKAMICLTMAGIDWRPDFAPDFATLPHGKLPVLDDGAQMIPDSGAILNWIEAQGADLFPGLDAHGRAQAHAMLRMLEESLRLGLVHDRWIDDGNWQVLRDAFFGEVPIEARAKTSEAVRDRVRAWLVGHGCARVSQTEALKVFFAPDLAVLVTLLEGQDWLMGGTAPTAVDALAVPLLQGMMDLPCDTPLRAAVRAETTLTAYVARGCATLYPPVEAVLSSAAAAA